MRPARTTIKQHVLAGASRQTAAHMLLLQATPTQMLVQIGHFACGAARPGPHPPAGHVRRGVPGSPDRPARPRGRQRQTPGLSQIASVHKPARSELQQGLLFVFSEL